MKNSDISIIVPIYNEEKVLACLYGRIIKVLEHLGLTYEIIFINDGSYDNSLKIIKEFNENNRRVKIISFSRNFGHQIAVIAGLRYASGACVIVTDADLQDPPELIIEMVDKWKQGADVVYGIRRSRKENLIKRICYKIFYRFLSKVSLVNIPLDAGDFCLMSRRVVIEMKKLCEEDPFVRGLRAWVGFKQVGIEYDRAAREIGESKYNFKQLTKLAFDGILSFSRVPLSAATFIGFIVSSASIGYALAIAVIRLLIALDIISANNLIPGWATLVCSMMFLVGLQFIFLGILGEYIGRIFMQIKNRPLYIVEEELGFRDDK